MHFGYLLRPVCSSLSESTPCFCFESLQFHLITNRELWPSMLPNRYHLLRVVFGILCWWVVFGFVLFFK